MALILSRKPGESIVLGIGSLPATAGSVPTSPFPDRDEPSGGGQAGSAPCAVPEVNSPPSTRVRPGPGAPDDRRPVKAGPAVR